MTAVTRGLGGMRRLARGLGHPAQEGGLEVAVPLRQGLASGPDTSVMWSV